jgi:hypothetical protein
MKLHQIYYREVNETSLGEKIHPFESDTESEWDSPEELIDFLERESGYQHGGVQSVDGDFVTMEDGYTVKVCKLN